MYGIVIDDSIVNIYCDESCHLEADGQSSMTLGAVVTPGSHVADVAAAMRDLKVGHGLARTFEAKWTKVSPAKLDYYLAVIDLFLDDADLRFRAVVAPKADLNHEAFGQDHDTWYYKMYYEVLHFVIAPPRRHRIYLDIKGSNGGAKVRKLREVLANANHDWSGQVVERVQIVRSDEVELLQLTDLLVGAVSSRARGTGSAAKALLAKHLEDRAGVRLGLTSPLASRKVNIFHWHPSASPRTARP
ncbi:MAG: DUF3800 domain-containing protein [Chloroflexota bacterium]|jgi:hypothetical protein